ncbi:Leucine-rich repeat-containing protein 63 [Dissostichus eleginoides]|uniref:Leucine-rich repeat-containing protein 63 n=1 Tax=Dissostichus eleginoides TaxID=100907 RepID=A0AAD9FKI1_DISEL|nr:Leucine-rich repeat-containing protein 63 [Dissostichus eleginoides]
MDLVVSRGLGRAVHPASAPRAYQSEGTNLPPAASTPCPVFLEDRRGVINESCVLITTNSLWGIFKGLQRRGSEGALPSMG